VESALLQPGSDLTAEGAEPERDQAAGLGSEAATIAVCVCTCDRLDGLAACLAAISRADVADLTAERLFVLVVDNKPDGRVRRFCEAALQGVVCVEEPRRGISHARNRAVREALARGADLIAFVDDDDEPQPDWLRELVLTQQRTGAELVLGRWRHAPGTAIPDWLGGVRYLQAPSWDRLDHYGLPGGTGTFNVLIARTLIEQLAPDGVLFLPELAHCGGSDRELFVRAVRSGARHALARESFVIRGWDPERLTLRGVLRRGFRLGHTEAIVERRHRSADELREWFHFNLSKLRRLLLGLPTRLLSRRKRMKRLYRIARAVGAINAHLGRNLTYYG
jgi:succinoglycan biosynthesis protein ExoM